MPEQLCHLCDRYVTTTVFVETGQDCPLTPDEVVLTWTPKQFNALVEDGVFLVRLDAGIGVNAAQCVDGLCSFELRYEAVDSDCNNNAMADSCEIANGAIDSDADGILDECELSRGDLNLDGQVSAPDLAMLLSVWGMPRPPYGDLNNDGEASAADLAILLGNWS